MMKSTALLALIGSAIAQDSVLQLAQATDDLSTLVNILTSNDGYSGLVAVLGGSSDITAFAPSNQAFADFQSEFGVNCTDESAVAACTEVISYHVLGLALDTSVDESRSVYTTSLGGTSYLLVDGTQTNAALYWGLNGPSNVLDGFGNLEASNGRANIIDKVLYPLPQTPSSTATDAGLTSLVASLGAADLVDAVDGAGPLTIFAPTDAAFAAIAGVTSRLTDAELVDVLTAHVVGAAVFAQDLPVTAPTNTLNDAEQVTVSTTAVTIVGGNSATISTADVITDNGVVHVIDSVLIPSNLVLPTDKTVAENLGLVTEVSRLAEILSEPEYSDVVAFFSAPDNINKRTLFAPSNAAFAAFEVDGVNCKDGDAAIKEVCKATFFYHAASPANDYSIPDGTSFLQSRATTATAGEAYVNLGDEGQTLTLNKATVDGETVISINDGPTVQEADIVCSNGVIHVIDSVISLPGSLATVASGADFLSTLVTVLTATDLLTTVDTTASITVFAPTDTAFADLEENFADTYAACVSEVEDDLVACGDVLQYHVVGAVAYSSDLSDGDVFTTLQTGNLTVNIADSGTVSIKDAAGNSATVTAADVSVRNGVVHVVDRVLLFDDSAAIAQVTGAAVAVVAMVSAILA